MTPGRPVNPRFIVIDTSVLLQLIATEQLPLLRFLRAEYGIQPAIADAVEAETLHILINVKKFKGRQEQFRKALSNGAISLINQESLSGIVGTDVDSLLRQINSEGSRFSRRVDRGEAYSHAVAGVLDVPVATNDLSAVNRLLRDRERLPRPILRFWDLVVFGNQAGHLEDSACDRVRQYLVKLQETQLPCFSKQSFRAGLAGFYARLLDGNRPMIGALEPIQVFDERLTVFRTHQQAA